MDLRSLSVCPGEPGRRSGLPKLGQSCESMEAMDASDEEECTEESGRGSEESGRGSEEKLAAGSEME